MASKNTSLYLTDRTFESFRPGDSNSGRINRIVDRYLEIVELEAEHVRAAFDDDEWQVLQTSWTKESQGLPAQTAWGVVLREVGGEATELGKKVDAMYAGDFFVLLELLEREQISQRLAEASGVPG